MIAIPKNPKGTLTELMQMLPIFYSEVLEMVEIQRLSAEQINKLIDVAQELFIDSNIITASEKIIAFYEKIIGIKYSSQRTLEERRRLVLVYYNIFGKISASKIKRALKFYIESDINIDFSKKDKYGNYILEITCDRGYENIDFESVGILLQKIIPAHLNPSIIIEIASKENIYAGAGIEIYTELVASELCYLTDEAGNYLTDEEGNRLICSLE